MAFVIGTIGILGIGDVVGGKVLAVTVGIAAAETVVIVPWGGGGLSARDVFKSNPRTATTSAPIDAQPAHRANLWSGTDATREGYGVAPIPAWFGRRDWIANSRWRLRSSFGGRLCERAAAVRSATLG